MGVTVRQTGGQTHVILIDICMCMHMHCSLGPLELLLLLLVVHFLEVLGASSPWPLVVTPICWRPDRKNYCFESLVPPADLITLTCSTCSLDLWANSGPNKDGAVSPKFESSTSGRRDEKLPLSDRAG